MRIKGIKILRVYGNFIEQKRFPIPNQIQSTRPIASKQELRVPKNLRRIALHYVIRNRKTSPYAEKLRRLESFFAAKKKKKKKVEEERVEEYLEVRTHQWKSSYPKYLTQSNCLIWMPKGQEKCSYDRGVWCLTRVEALLLLFDRFCLLFSNYVNVVLWLSFVSNSNCSSTGLAEVASAKSQLLNFVH